jgi:hypothetical protein
VPHLGRAVPGLIPDLLIGAVLEVDDGTIRQYLKKFHEAFQLSAMLGQIG